MKRINMGFVMVIQYNCVLVNGCLGVGKFGMGDILHYTNDTNGIPTPLLIMT